MSEWIVIIGLWVFVVWLYEFSPSARYQQKIDREKAEFFENFRVEYEKEKKDRKAR